MVRPQRELVRVVRTPDGSVMLDVTGRAAGRGAYLCPDPACWQLAARRASLERSLSISIPAELRSRLEQGDVASLHGGSHGA
jgi:predicted RNA-binding protein YlxR (DUF448 family)